MSANAFFKHASSYSIADAAWLAGTLGVDATVITILSVEARAQGMK